MSAYVAAERGAPLAARGERRGGASPDTPERAARRRTAIASLRHNRFAGVTARLLPQPVHPRQVATPLADEVRAMAARVGRAMEYPGRTTALRRGGLADD